MTLAGQFAAFGRVFESSEPITTATQKAQEIHAGKVVEWLDLTTRLMEAPRTMAKEVQFALSDALVSTRALYAQGDDISAWLGQCRIAKAAEKVAPGSIAAQHLAAAARMSAYLYRLDDAEKYLRRMYRQMTRPEPPIATQYWSLKGLLLNMNRRFKDAIPNFQLALEYLQQTSPREAKYWLSNNREDVIANRMLHIADCWLNLGWDAVGDERLECAAQARRIIERAVKLPKLAVEQYLAGLNVVELNILEGRFDEARQGIDYLLHHQTNSQKAAVLRPAAYFMLARLADIEDDHNAMIGHLSRALAESMVFPNALQELTIVEGAIELMKRHSSDRQRLAPLMEAMVVMLEAKDWYTGRDHSKSVVRYTLTLWDNWHGRVDDPGIRDDLYWAGYLHDIGKLRLPRSLLNKIAPLCDTEWTMIRQHPTHGKDILETFGVPRIAQWVSEHHQNASGTGYPGSDPASPMGLCITISDILEAATNSNRKYKKPKTIPQALSELKASGDHRYPQSLIETAERMLTG